MSIPRNPYHLKQTPILFQNKNPNQDPYRRNGIVPNFPLINLYTHEYSILPETNSNVTPNQKSNSGVVLDCEFITHIFVNLVIPRVFLHAWVFQEWHTPWNKLQHYTKLKPLLRIPTEETVLYQIVNLSPTFSVINLSLKYGIIFLSNFRYFFGCVCLFLTFFLSIGVLIHSSIQIRVLILSILTIYLSNYSTFIYICAIFINNANRFP